MISEHPTRVAELAKTFKHQWRYEQDTGFIVARTNGIIDESDAAEYAALYARDVPPGEAGFMLCDNRSSTGLTPGARKRFARDWNPTELYLVGFGQSFAVRVILNTFMQGLALIRPQYSVTMVADEEGARAWLTEKRRAYLARKAKT